jgi:hypothetical protein
MLRTRTMLPVLLELCLVSCAAKKAPDQIRVTAPLHYSGKITISPCMPGAARDVTLKEDGSGETSVCPAGDVVLTVVRGNDSKQIAVEVVRTGDGIAVGIEAEIH